MNPSLEFNLKQLFSSQQSDERLSFDNWEPLPIASPDPLLSYYLIDSEDIEILMHRDVHFGGSFAIMLEYYYRDGKGVYDELSLERIEELAKLEEKAGKNLAPYLLAAQHLERIAEARKAYKSLKDVYEASTSPSVALAVADLLLSEEEEPSAAIAQVAAYGEKATSLLTSLLQAKDFSDPLFPGYGHGPKLAAAALGQISDPQAIQALFSSIGQEDFLGEEGVLDALFKIGDPARDFLLKQLSSKRLTRDNEKAAIALQRFNDDPQVIAATLELLSDPAIWSQERFASYLCVLLPDLLDEPSNQLLQSIAANPQFPPSLKNELSWRHF